ncbi:hypothetical protein NN561_007881 [Cricetulus griseus]
MMASSTAAALRVPREPPPLHERRRWLSGRGTGREAPIPAPRRENLQEALEAFSATFHFLLGRPPRPPPPLLGSHSPYSSSRPPVTLL